MSRKQEYPLFFKWATMLWLLCSLSGCTYLAAPPVVPDPDAERLVASLKKANTDLNAFKCVAKIGIFSPDRPVQAFRGALAGQLPDRLRIDLFAPFGGAAASLASDGSYLFIALHGERKYYKKGIGDGSLKQLMKIDFTVDDLLSLLVGRIPIGSHLIAQKATDGSGVSLVDKKGRLRQSIALDADGYPRSAIWYDGRNRRTLSFAVDGKQEIDGFTLPRNIVIADVSGNKVSVSILRYDANTELAPSLFVLPPISS